MTSQQLFNYSYLDITVEFYEAITETFSTGSLLFLEGGGKLLGHFPCSDMLLLFNRAGEMVVACERVNRCDVPLHEYLYLKALTWYKLHNKTGLISCTMRKDYFDIVRVRREWWSFVSTMV